MSALSFGFIGLTLIVIAFLLFIGFKAIDASSTKISRDKLILTSGLLIWHVYILALSSTEFIMDYGFPPRFALAFILPSFLFTGIFLFRSKNKTWIQSIPEHWIIYFQSFRILVEILFLFALTEGIFNPEVTLEGYNFDMIYAFSAPIVGLLVFRFKVLPRGFLKVWNYLGLVVFASIIFVFMTCIYAPELYGGASPLLPLKAFSYPYVLIAGFLMPAAVFLHVLSIVQLSKTPS
ncbi:MAG: hypothetical protein ACPGED_12360 [Flavobacteriales bacterium]